MNGAELREALKAKGITSGQRLAEYLGSPAVIFFIMNDASRYKRAELVYTKDGRREILVRAPARGLETLTEKRNSAVERARVAAEGLIPYGRDDWSRAPFSNCWLPTEMISKLHEEFEKDA